MSARLKRDHQLLEEVQTLRIQLQEAEETLDAIRHGEIDALVVNGPEGEQVFTLQGADHPYRLMVETMREGAVTVALDSTILYCNQSFAELVGVAPERVTGTSIGLYVASEDVSRFAELMEAGKSGSTKAELNLRSETGALVPVSISTSALHVDQLPAVCLVVTDLTEHKHNEELRASEKLAKALQEQSEVLLAREQEARSEAEQANRIKDEFLATMSHELRNPLSAILGWTNILRRSREISKDEGDNALNVIERNARVQLKLIEDLLDVSRIVSGKLAFSFLEVDVAKVIAVAVEAAQPAASSKRVHLDFKAGDACGTVLGDAGRLQQIVGNLLSNAIKFTPAGGTVNVKVDIQPKHAVITVADTGEGISAEFLPLVFERFRQADGSTKRVQGGLGLGLAIVRHLVELHGGSVIADSLGIGQGARFTVTLPLSTVQPGEATALNHSAEIGVRGKEPENSLILEGIKILVVDDDNDGREFLQILLTENGAQVKAVANAAEGHGEVHKNPPDILICDIGLPNEDGYEFIRRIRSINDSSVATIPALALTAYARTNDRAQALTAGYQDHLAKPVESNELLRAIVSIARRGIVNSTEQKQN